MTAGIHPTKENWTPRVKNKQTKVFSMATGELLRTEKASAREAKRFVKADKMWAQTHARRHAQCPACQQWIPKGSLAKWNIAQRTLYHSSCTMT